MTAVDRMYPNNWRVPMMTMDEFSRTISAVRGQGHTHTHLHLKTHTNTHTNTQNT